jgi:hypothetical protein
MVLYFLAISSLLLSEQPSMDLLCVRGYSKSILIKHTCFFFLFLGFFLLFSDEILPWEALKALVLSQGGISCINSLVWCNFVRQPLNKIVLLPFFWLGLIFLLSWINDDSINRNLSAKLFMTVIKHSLLVLNCFSLAYERGVYMRKGLVIQLMDFIAFRALTSFITDVPSKSFRDLEVLRFVINLLLFLLSIRHRDTDTNFSIVLCHLIVWNTVLNRSFLDGFKFCLPTEICHKFFVPNYFLVLVHSLSSNFSELTPEFPSSDFHSSQPDSALE